MNKWVLVLTLFWSPLPFATEKPEGISFCHSQTVIKFTFDKSNQNNDVLLTVDGKTQTVMTAYSWFGSTQQSPKGFKFAILGEGRFDPLLVFEDHLIDAVANKYLKCTQKPN
jgi:hypothetical protein